MAGVVEIVARRQLWSFASILALLFPLFFSVSPPRPARAETCEWQKGFSFWSPTGRYDSQEAFDSLTRLKETGANYVSPIATLYVQNGSDSRVERAADTPSDEELAAFADKAHELGLKVLLKIHVDSLDKTWRGFFDPSDKQAWFASYAPFVEEYARLSAEHGIEGIAIGSELIGLSGPPYTAYWKDLIARVRAVYSGFLTYSANWGGGIADKWPDKLEEFTKIEFWSDLDYLGISAYFELSNVDYPSMDDLLNGWDRWFQSRIAPFQAAQNKPLLITEVGYKSTVGAADHPWDQNLEKGVDLKAQAELYEAFFKFWSKVPWVHGAYFWHWTTNPADGGVQDTDYTPQNKPAQQTITSWFTLPDWLALKRWTLLDGKEPLKVKENGPLPNVALSSGPVEVWAFFGQLTLCRNNAPTAKANDSTKKTEGAGSKP